MSAVWTFSLRELFLWTAFVALGCVALRNASGTLSAAMLSLAVLVLAAAILLAVFRDGGRRAFWIGFGTFGWLYLLVLALGWSFSSNSGSSPLRPYNLTTTRISNASYHWLYDDAFAKYYANQQQTSGYGSGGYGGGMPGGMMGTPDGGLDMMGSGGEYGGGGDAGMYGSGMSPGGSGYPGMGGGMPAPAPPAVPPGPNEEDFANVAHALWAILLAMVGGCFASWLYATKRNVTTSP
jgi:hypothetical protein